MNTIKDFDKICKNCDHTMAKHYHLIKDPDHGNNPKAQAGVCKNEKCTCKKFEPKK